MVNGIFCSNNKEWNLDLLVNKTKYVTFELDTGAMSNVISKHSLE